VLLHLGLRAFDWDDRQMICAKRRRIAGPILALASAMNLAAPAHATMPEPAGGGLIVLAQAMIPRTGMMDAQNPMPMKERYLKRFPQPARVGDLIGMAGARSSLEGARLCAGRADPRWRDRVYCRL